MFLLSDQVTFLSVWEVGIWKVGSTVGKVILCLKDDKSWTRVVV